MKEQGFNFEIVVESDKPLTEQQLKEIANTVYAAIESELEENRKGKAEEYTSARINDYTIYPRLLGDKEPPEAGPFDIKKE